MRNNFYHIHKQIVTCLTICMSVTICNISSTIKMCNINCIIYLKKLHSNSAAVCLLNPLSISNLDTSAGDQSSIFADMIA